MDKLRHIWLHGSWNGTKHTTADFGYDGRGRLCYACSCGQVQGNVPNMRD